MRSTEKEMYLTFAEMFYLFVTIFLAITCHSSTDNFRTLIAPLLTIKKVNARENYTFNDGNTRPRNILYLILALKLKTSRLSSIACRWSIHLNVTCNSQRFTRFTLDFSHKTDDFPAYFQDTPQKKNFTKLPHGD